MEQLYIMFCGMWICIIYRYNIFDINAAVGTG